MMRQSLALIVLLALDSMACAQSPDALPGFAIPRGSTTAIELVDLDGDRIPEAIIQALDAKGRATWRIAHSDSGPMIWGAPSDPFTLPEDVGGWMPGDLHPDSGNEIALFTPSGAQLLRWPAEGAPKLTPLLEEPLLVHPRAGRVPRRIGWARGGATEAERARFLLPARQSTRLVIIGPDGEVVTSADVGPRTRFEDGARGGGAFTLGARRPRLGFLSVREGGPEGFAWMTRDGIHVQDAPGAPSRLRWRWIAAPEGRDLERIAPSLVDLDGDAYTDCVSLRTATDAAGITNPKTSLTIHRGHPDAGETATSTLLIEGVISFGPKILDVNGDGRSDLWLGVSQGAVGQRLQGVFGKVTMKWQLWIGREGRRPFGRSPALTIDDGMPKKVFDQWNRRHRLRVASDLTGDGIADLVRHDATRKFRVTVHAGQVDGEGFRFADEPSFVIEHEQTGAPESIRMLDLERQGQHLEVRWADAVRFVPLRKN